MQQEIKNYYWDHNATTPLAPAVKEAMLPFLGEFFGNASALYPLGKKSAQAVAAAREQLASYLKVRPSEIIWTSGATESIATAFHAALNAPSYKSSQEISSPNQKKRRIITSTVEHPATLRVCRYYAQKGYEVIYLPVDRLGRFSLTALEETLQEARDKKIEVPLVSLLWANNETGVVSPVKEIASCVARYQVPLHLDATQVLGKLPIDLTELPVSYLSLSAHKCYGPKGVGALYLQRHAFFTPLLPGHQEGGRRGGTENVAGIVGFGEAIKEIERLGLEEIERQRQLRDLFETMLLVKIPRVTLHSVIPKEEKTSGSVERLPNTSHFRIARVSGEVMSFLLGQQGIACATGSACSSSTGKGSHVLEAMGLSLEELQGSLRFSLGRGTTAEEVIIVTDILQEMVKKTDSLSQ